MGLGIGSRSDCFQDMLEGGVGGWWVELSEGGRGAEGEST